MYICLCEGPEWRPETLNDLNGYFIMRQKLTAKEEEIMPAEAREIPVEVTISKMQAL